MPVTDRAGTPAAGRPSDLAFGDVRHWLDDRLQTQAAVVYSSVNLDFDGIGRDPGRERHPLRYELGPRGGVLRAKLRLGESTVMAGLAMPSPRRGSRSTRLRIPACYRTSDAPRTWAGSHRPSPTTRGTTS